MPIAHIVEAACGIETWTQLEAEIGRDDLRRRTVRRFEQRLNPALHRPARIRRSP